MQVTSLVAPARGLRSELFGQRSPTSPASAGQTGEHAAGRPSVTGTELSRFNLQSG